MLTGSMHLIFSRPY